MPEGVVQVTTPTGNKAIRNREQSIVEPDGTTAVVEQQVVVLAHSDGTLFDADEQRARLVHDTAALTTETYRTGSYPLLTRAFTRDTVGQR